ncbi:hypothetical protein Tco_1141803, partial [Tanacetum coccineum]
MKACNRGVENYGMNEEGVLKFWYCYLNNDIKSIRGSGLSFPEFLLENYKKVQGDNTYWWYDQKSEEEERREIGTDIEGYDPPSVHVETFKIKRYSFDSGQSFICVTKELMNALPLGKENESRFREIIRSLSKELEFEVSSARCHVVN